MHVPYPLFELVGPPCPTNGCGGTLVVHLNLGKKERFRVCSKCTLRVDNKRIESGTK